MKSKYLLWLSLMVSAFLMISIKAGAQQSFISTFSYAPLNAILWQGRPLPCSDGTFLITASATWTNSGPGTYTNMLAARLDSAGNLLWSKSFGNSVSSSIACAAETPTGFLLSGFMQASSVLTGTLVFIKIDQNGDTIWTRKYQDCGEIYSLHQMPNGDFMCTGYRSGIPSYHPQVMRIDSSGTILWRAEFQHQPGVGVGGRNGYTCADGSTLFYFQSTVVVKLDAAGNYAWSLPRYNFPNPLWSHDIIEMADSTYLLVGYMNIPGKGYEGMLTKISTSGTILWMKSIGNSATADYLYSAAPLSDGTVLLHGAMYDTTAQSNPSAWTVNTDTSGNVLWSKRFYGMSFLSYGYHVEDCPVSGGYVSTGTALDTALGSTDLLVLRNMFDSTSCLMHDAPLSTDTVTPINIISINVTPLTTPYNECDSALYISSNVLTPVFHCFATGINAEEENTGLMSVYPNPFYDRLSIDVTGYEKIKVIELRDVFGKTIKEFKNFTGNEISLPGLRSGFYFLTIKTGKKTVVKKLVRQ